MKQIHTVYSSTIAKILKPEADHIYYRSHTISTKQSIILHCLRVYNAQLHIITSKAAILLVYVQGRKEATLF